MTTDDGFDEFYQSAFGRLVGQVYLVTGDLGDAEDAVQEAFPRASTRWVKVREFTVPELWVRRVAMDLAIDGLRRTRRRLAAFARLSPSPRRCRSRLSVSPWSRRCGRCPAPTGR